MENESEEYDWNGAEWCLASGESGGFEITVTFKNDKQTDDLALDTPTDESKYKLYIAYGLGELGFQIHSTSVVNDILNFMQENYGKTRCFQSTEEDFLGSTMYCSVAEISLGTPGEDEIFLRKDGELKDEFLFSINRKDLLFYFSLRDPEVTHVIKALENLVQDIHSKKKHTRTIDSGESLPDNQLPC